MAKLGKELGDVLSSGLENDLSLPTLVGLANLSNPRALQTANPGGVPGVATGFAIYGLVRPLASGNGNYWISRLAAAAGWGVIQPTATTVAFRCADGGGTLVTSAEYTLAPSINKELGFVAVHTGSNLQFWVNNAQVGADVAITGFTVNSNRTYIGAAGSASAFFDWYGAGGTSAAPTAQSIAEWFSYVKARRSVVAMPRVTNTSLWRPQIAASVPDLVGTQTMSLVGTGHSVVKRKNPAFAW